MAYKYGYEGWYTLLFDNLNPMTSSRFNIQCPLFLPYTWLALNVLFKYTEFKFKHLILGGFDHQEDLNLDVHV